MINREKKQLIDFIHHFTTNTIIRVSTEFDKNRVDMICFVHDNQYHYSLCDIDLYEVKDYEDYNFCLAMLQSDYVKEVTATYNDDNDMLNVHVLVEC